MRCTCFYVWLWEWETEDCALGVQGNTPLPKGNLERHYSEGVLFVTYSLLVSNTKSMAEPRLPGADKAADVQNDFRIPKGSRLEQIINWLNGGDGDALIVRDPSPLPWSLTCCMHGCITL